MKINKRNPSHLLLLAVSIVTSCIAIAIRFAFRTKQERKIVIFYGHTLNGNLKAFFDFLKKEPDYVPYFLTLDRQTQKSLIASGEHDEHLLTSLSLQDMLLVAKADAIITSHGLHFFSLFKSLHSIKFIDVWHGIPFKGFDADDFKHLHDYDQTWVSSELLKKMYVNKFGFESKKVKVTGYGRVDQLVDKSLDRKKLIKKYDIAYHSKYVLIAPTWKQDDSGRSILPFGASESDFFKKIDACAQSHNAGVIFRTHLNSGDDLHVDGLKNTYFMPYSAYELAEEFLFIADILVTDWSSIAFDYLPLHRPTIFLDVEPPFKKGFSLDTQYRFGSVASSLGELVTEIEIYLKTPELYTEQYGARAAAIEEELYDTTLDGNSCKRYLKELNEIL